MNPGAVLETDRLRLSPFADAETDELHRLFLDPGVRRYLLDDTLVPREWVEQEVQKSTQLFADCGYGLWSVRLRDAPDIIGFAGYRFFHDPPELQLLYGFHPSWWGRGIATEAARAVVRYGFDAVGFAEIIASADVPNESSFRVMERLGMKFEKRVKKSGLDTVYYRLERSAFT